MNTILKEVKDWLSGKIESDYTEKRILEQLQEHGCVSGMVSPLIYYYDTCRFYNKHRKAIFSLLDKFCFNTGMGIKEFLQTANNFPMSKAELERESFALGIPGLIKHNPEVADQIKNWFAWFGFEETAFQYYSEKYES